MDEKLVMAVDKLLGLNSAAILALGTLCGGLIYVGVVVGDFRRDLADVAEQQTSNHLCERIRACPTESGGAHNGIGELRIQVRGLQETLAERGIRIQNLEHQVNELRTKPSSRPDPFTGMQGRALEKRIQDLESMQGQTQ